MFLRLSTVRSKLTALVLTTLVMMLATLPLLSWLLDKQLVDEVDDRVESARKSFQTELDDDLADLTLAARVIAADSDTARSLAARDAQKADDLAALFVGVYPDLDVLLADPSGVVLAQVGCASPVRNLHAIAELGPSLGLQAPAREFRGLTAHGCESRADAPPAYMIAAPVAGVGFVVVCLPINTAHLANAADKLGLALALVRGGEVIDRSRGFPPAPIGGVREISTLVEQGGHTFAMARFAPPQLEAKAGGLTIVAALDVSDVKHLVRNHLYFALGVLALATLISVGFGFRLAQVMSVALLRVNHALKRLEQQEYVHIDALKTGDELEDLATGFNLMVDGLKERDKLRTTFGKYMTAQVVEHLMSGKVQLGGEVLQVTILFTDIRSFTSISEKMDAQALVGLLNEYFTEMVGIVMAEDGVVDKYIGDAIMAVFGAPVPKKDDAVNAVRAAVRMRTALAHLNARLSARGLTPLRTGIGIHTGEVVAGNIGSEQRMEYTVIGDAVNLASRLESNTKDLGVDVLISEDTWQLVKDHIVARPVKELTVKGRLRPVMTYEVLGIEGEAALPPAQFEAENTIG